MLAGFCSLLVAVVVVALTTGSFNSVDFDCRLSGTARRPCVNRLKMSWRVDTMAPATQISIAVKPGLVEIGCRGRGVGSRWFAHVTHKWVVSLVVDCSTAALAHSLVAERAGIYRKGGTVNPSQGNRATVRSFPSVVTGPAFPIPTELRRHLSQICLAALSWQPVLSVEPLSMVDTTAPLPRPGRLCFIHPACLPLPILSH